VKQGFICTDALVERPDKVKHLSHLLTSSHTVSQASPGVQLFITWKPHIRDAAETFLPRGVQVIPFSPNRDAIREYLKMELKHDSDSGAMNLFSRPIF